jgi:hypothetical protein
MELINPPKSSDSRNSQIIVSDTSGRFQRAYCYLCGAPCGWISKESSAFVSPEHFITTCDRCDSEVIALFGDLPFDKVPTEFFDAFGYKPEKGDQQCCGTTPQQSSPPVR